MSRLSLKIIGIVCAVSMMFASFALADAYENDDASSRAVYIPNSTSAQHHNFHIAGDQDWVKFYAFSGEMYSITATNIGSRCNVVLGLYNTDGATLIKEWDDTFAGVGDDETIQWTCANTGVYYAKVKHNDSSVFGDGTEYDLKVLRQAGNNGNIKGVIYDQCSSKGISGVKITVSGNGITDSFTNPFVGDYIISLLPNTSYTIKFEAVGYKPFQAQNILVKPFQEFTGIDIPLEPLSKNTYYRDADGDGYGDPKTSIQSCNTTPPSGYVKDNTDCNDADAAIHPGATEICDGKDNNCNGQVDEGFTKSVYYRDADGDGYGDPNNSIQSCDTAPPSGYVKDNSDCNDADPAIHPGATEICDGKDNNCNGQVDEGCQVYTYYRDVDKDGYGDPKNSTQSTSPTPPAGYVANKTDCNDADAAIYPGATEICDGKDNNCNGKIDEGFPVDVVIKGAITNKCSGEKVSGVKITVSGNGKIETISDVGGDYTISFVPNTLYDVKFEAAGYETVPFKDLAGLSCQDVHVIDIELTPIVEISDVIKILRILSDINAAPPICLKDHRLEMADAIYILQVVAGLR